MDGGIPSPKPGGETVAKKLVEEVVCRFGVPGQLHSDQGRNFESKVMAEMCRLLGINKTRTTPLNPKSDGLVERFNRTILDVMAKFLQPHKNQRDWDGILPTVCHDGLQIHHSGVHWRESKYAHVSARDHHTIPHASGATPRCSGTRHGLCQTAAAAD